MDDTRLWGTDEYNRPLRCKHCDGVMVFKGVGEYQCEDCRAVDYDDYGKVRLYVEKHPGATMSETAAQTGVSQKSIRQLLRDDRLEITSDSAAFLKCDICGAMIRSGRFCQKCQLEYNRRIEEKQRALKAPKQMAGHGQMAEQQDGARRFNRQ